MKRNYFIYILALLLIFISILFVKVSDNNVKSFKKDFNNCKINDSICLSKYYLNYADGNGFKNSLIKLENYISKNPNQASTCHVIAHSLGRKAWKKFEDLSEIYREETNVCSFGFLHGAITEAISTMPRDEIVSKSNQFCDKLRNINVVAEDECFHGLGHAFVVKFSDFKESITLCEKFNLNKNSQSCLQGAVMEYSSTFPKNEIEAANLSSKLYSDCTILENKLIAEGCVFAVSSPSIRSDGKEGNSTKAWERCLKLSEEYLSRCAMGIGQAAPSITNWSPSLTSMICHNIEKEYTGYCVKYAVRIFGTVFLDINKSKEFCDKLDIPFREICTSELPFVESEIKIFQSSK